METFHTDLIEKLKIQFYTVVGRLELEKHIKISSQNIQIFEQNLSKCSDEGETAGCILGAIRRYESMLMMTPSHQTSVKSSLRTIDVDAGCAVVIGSEEIVSFVTPHQTVQYNNEESK